MFTGNRCVRTEGEKNIIKHQTLLRQETQLKMLPTTRLNVKIKCFSSSLTVFKYLKHLPEKSRLIMNDKVKERFSNIFRFCWKAGHVQVPVKMGSFLIFHFYFSTVPHCLIRIAFSVICCWLTETKITIQLRYFCIMEMIWTELDCSRNGSLFVWSFLDCR